ncbi:MAG: hypothetical protein HC841_05540 [Verrucomicrobiae bacterium]|nr:hypothetical protein [Verrucomicrobiae bacterium]
MDIVGIQIGLEALRSAVTTRCFESLFFSWDTYFGKLVAFKDRFGHCNVETLWEEDLSLARWVTAQRTRRRKGALSNEQVARLDGLGFVWNWQEQSADENWLRWFQKLNLFKERFGHCNVETGWEEDPQLAGWVSGQRIRRKKDELTAMQVQRLEELGFVWDWNKRKADETWMKWYRELENYAKENGNPHVPRTHTNTKLASWVWIQRLRRDKDYNSQPKLTSDQIALLDKLGFRWDALGDQWAENFERLKQFKEKHGHCEIGLVAAEDDKLRRWVSTQRLQQARGEMDAERKVKLDVLGFSWSSENSDLRWMEMFERLKQYLALKGDADVPALWDGDVKLGAWVSAQRQRRKQGQIPDEQIRLLDSLGFTWQHRERGSWEDRLAEVAAFKAKHGHCEIPLNTPENPKLGRFVNSMRTKRNSGRLSADRIAKLDALGFAWESSRTAEVGGDGIIASWKKRFDELLGFKEANGDCKVPADWAKNPPLGRWVSQQRSMKKAGKLHPKREEMLNEIGFDWGGTGSRLFPS